jgi:putative serine protease PepD
MKVWQAVAAVALVAGCSSSSTSGGGPVSGGASDLETQYETVASHVLPSVVQISSTSGTGSGVVFDSHGDIVTNAHVVGHATTVKVLRATGSDEFVGRVIGLAVSQDLAVVRVTSGVSSLKPVPFDTATPRTGQIVLAMGSPLGLTGTVTQGIISGNNRTVEEASSTGSTFTTLENAVQTSAPINSGNSGGPLVSLSGQVVGINSAAARDPQAGAAPGIGFAISAATAKSIATKLIASAP